MAERFCKKVAVALVIALCFAILPGIWQLQASSATGSVTFTYEGMQDCSIRLYYVADYSETDGYRISSDFAETNVSRQDIEDEKWYSLAMTLESLVVGFDITPSASGATYENGEVAFNGLKEGLYLVTIESMVVGDTMYTAQPLLIMIPEYDSDGTANYDESVTITKYETQKVSETTSVSVQKVWDDDDSASRPTSLAVYLLKGSDGSVADTQILSDSNNWRYTWSELDGSEVWYVMEENLDEYGVSYTTADDGTIVLTNEQGTGRTHSMHTIPPDDLGDTETSEEESQTETEDTEETQETETVTEDTETEEESESTSELEPTEISNYMEESETTESSEEPYSEDSETPAESESDSVDSSGNTTDSQTTGSSGSDGSSSGTASQGSTSTTLPQTGANWWIVIILTVVAAGCFLIGIRIDPLSKHSKEEKSKAES